MDKINLVYKELFSVQFIHDAYHTPRTALIQDDILVIPDKVTKTFLLDHNIGYRLNADTFFCFIQTKPLTPPATDPKIPFWGYSEPVRMRFFIRPNSRFISKTLVVAAGKQWTYQFSNNINHTNATNIFLHQAVETHSPARDYQEGTIVKQGAQSFVARKTMAGSAATPITDTSAWMLIVANAVVNNADLRRTSSVGPDDDCFGVIDIYNTGMVNPAYNLFGADQRLNSPVYTLAFKSKL